MVGVWRSGVNVILFSVIWLFFVAYLSSYVIQDHFFIWMIVDSAIVVMIAGVLIWAWWKHRSYPNRVAMLSAFATVGGMAFFMIIPLLIKLFPSLLFILISVGTLLLFNYLYKQSKGNEPGHSDLKWKALFTNSSIFIAVLIFLFCLFLVFFPDTVALEFWTIAAIILYSFGMLLVILMMEVLRVLEKSGKILR